jgi:tryptophan halogenase
MAVGLSSNFIEPLESTSLWLTTAQLETFKHFINEINELNQSSIDQFNEICRNNMDEVLNFVYLHYITKRDDSDFWKNFKVLKKNRCH